MGVVLEDEDERIIEDRCAFGVGTGAPCAIIQVDFAGLARRRMDRRATGGCACVLDAVAVLAGF